MIEELGATTVGSVMANGRSLPRWALVCLPELPPLASHDECLVVDGRDLDDDEDVPCEAVECGLTRVLSPEQIVDVLDNVRLQLGDATEQQMLEALNHYLLADAFISFSDDRR